MKIISDFLDLGHFDSSLPLKEKVQIVTSMPHLQEVPGLDFESTMKSVILNEISQTFFKTIFSKLSTCEEDIIDVLLRSEDGSIDSLRDYLIENNFNFIVTSVKISHYIQAHQDFNYLGKQNTVQNSLTRNLGKINDIQVFESLIKKFDDKVILCGRSNPFIYNYEITKFNEPINTTTEI
jgi:hypothetical protein